MQNYRMPKPMPWKVFVGRRRLNVQEFLLHNKLRSYDALVVWCGNNNVIPPLKTDMKGMFGTKRKEEPVKPAAAPEVPKVSKPPKKKRPSKLPPAEPKSDSPPEPKV